MSVLLNNKITKAEFETYEIVGFACDGSPIRREPEFGNSVWEAESGHPVSPIAYSIRKELRKKFGSAIGDV